MPDINTYDSDFAEELTRVIKAGQATGTVRACLLTTRDRNFALSLMKRTVSECRAPLYHFTVAGRREYKPEQVKWVEIGGREPSPQELLRYSEEARGGGVVILEDCLIQLRDGQGDSGTRMQLAQMLARENSGDGLVLVFIEPPESSAYLPSMLADQFVRLDVPYPRAGELEHIAREGIALAFHRTRVPVDVERIQKEAARLATGMVGLSRSAARDSLMDALVPDIQDFEGAFRRLQDRKTRQLRRELAMNVLDTEEVEEPIGLDYLVDFLKMHKDRMPISGKGRARGVLLIGPPGTGKTMLARAIGKLVNLPVVEFRISSLMNSLLGETERRFSQAFATLEAMSPNVVFIDEIEKAFGDSSERDGGTMMRCTGSLLSWLSDNPHPNFIVATANNLSRMGEIGLTMTRSGRFDTSFFVDLPNQAGRKAMLRRWLKGKMDPAESVLDDLSSRTERFSGADLQSLVELASSRAATSRQPLSVEHLGLEIERKRMRALGLYDEFRELRNWGKIFCDPAGPVE